MSHPLSKQSVHEWILECFNDKTKKEEPSRFILLHLQNGMKKVELDSVHFGTDTKYDLKELANRFRGKADAYASELNGLQRFVLLGFWGESNEPGARKIFSIAGQNDLGEDGVLETEGPTTNGMASQCMRHNEALMKITLSHQRDLFQMQGETLDRLRSMNNKLSSENQDLFTLVREMLMKQVEMQHESRMKEIEAQGKRDMRELFMTAVPSLINSITGKEVFTEAKEDTALIESLIKKLTPEKFEQMAQILPPELLGPFSTRVQRSLAKRQELERDGQRRIENGVTPDNELQ